MYVYVRAKKDWVWDVVLGPRVRLSAVLQKQAVLEMVLMGFRGRTIRRLLRARQRYPFKV